MNAQGLSEGPCALPSPQLHMCPGPLQAHTPSQLHSHLPTPTSALVPTHVPTSARPVPSVSAAPAAVAVPAPSSTAAAVPSQRVTDGKLPPGTYIGRTVVENNRVIKIAQPYSTGHLQCPYYPACERTFKHASERVIHVRKTHTGDRPFKCPYEGCDKRFFSSKQCKSHQRSHSQDKPFVCSECGKGLGTSCALSYHIKAVHTKERPFRCENAGCGLTYMTKADLDRHMDKHRRKQEKAERAETQVLKRRAEHAEKRLERAVSTIQRLKGAPPSKRARVAVPSCLLNLGSGGGGPERSSVSGAGGGSSGAVGVNSSSLFEPLVFATIVAATPGEQPPVGAIGYVVPAYAGALQPSDLVDCELVRKSTLAALQEAAAGTGPAVCGGEDVLARASTAARDAHAPSPGRKQPPGAGASAGAAPRLAIAAAVVPTTATGNVEPGSAADGVQVRSAPLDSSVPTVPLTTAVRCAAATDAGAAALPLLPTAVRCTAATAAGAGALPLLPATRVGLGAAVAPTQCASADAPPASATKPAKKKEPRPPVTSEVAEERRRRKVHEQLLRAEFNRLQLRGVPYQSWRRCLPKAQHDAIIQGLHIDDPEVQEATRQAATAAGPHKPAGVTACVGTAAGAGEGAGDGMGAGEGMGAGVGAGEGMDAGAGEGMGVVAQLQPQDDVQAQAQAQVQAQARAQVQVQAHAQVLNSSALHLLPPQAGAPSAHERPSQQLPHGRSLQPVIVQCSAAGAALAPQAGGAMAAAEAAMDTPAVPHASEPPPSEAHSFLQATMSLPETPLPQLGMHLPPSAFGVNHHSVSVSGAHLGYEQSGMLRSIDTEGEDGDEAVGAPVTQAVTDEAADAGGDEVEHL